MHCARCGARLEANARFCRNCGLPVDASQSQNGSVSPSQDQGADKTVSISSLVERLRQPHAYPQQSYSQQPQPTPQEANTHPAFSQYAPPSQPQNPYQAREAGRGTPPYAPVVNTPKRRSRTGCILGCLGTFVVILLLLGVSWVYVIQPYAHGYAIEQMNNAMTNAVNEIPPIGIPLPPGTTVPISESTLNGVLANSPTNTNIVQNTNIQVTANQIVLDFEIYGQYCTITAVPQMQAGKLVASHVTISGIASLVLSPKDVTDMLNSHLEDIQGRLGHRVTNVHLADQEIDLTFS